MLGQFLIIKTDFKLRSSKWNVCTCEEESRAVLTPFCEMSWWLLNGFLEPKWLIHSLFLVTALLPQRTRVHWKVFVINVKSYRKRFLTHMTLDAFFSCNRNCLLLEILWIRNESKFSMPLHLWTSNSSKVLFHEDLESYFFCF